MTSLKHLDLSANNFNSSIPNWLYSFSHLEFLNLRKNLLQGTISSSIRNLTSAISIDLTSNQLDGKVPRSLGNVCKLRELRLSDNKFSQEVSKILESLLRCVSYGLEVLEMYDAQLSGHLIEGLGQFQNLSTLSLEGNSIWGPIPISIGKLSSLRFLDLSHNQFNGTLPQSFGGLSKLEHVFIGGNMLEGVVSETHFANLRRLKGLSTTPNRFTLKVSPNWIPPFQVLFLGLGSWILGPNFPLWICSQKRVWSLDISNTNVTDAIPPLFWNMSSQFYYLSLSHNHIYGEIPNIPVTLYPSSVIDMSSNSFNGSLPLISSNVSFLDLSNNLLSRSISHFLCYKKNEPKQMELLNLGKNLLSGNISYCWENWQKLLVLSLGNNNFTGSIPTSIEHLSLLKSLHLSNNKISGKLLHFLKNCTDLEIIDISENKFFGIIPSWIGQRHSILIILNLRSNNFHGPIPKQLCALTSLQILDFSHNRLFGSIPGCVNNLNAMISTSHNILQDLFVLDGDSVDFERLNLVIKGQVREYTTNLGLLRTIDLSKNNLSGEIPKEVTSLQGLQSLNLSFNNLIGRIPENIGAMGSLESLDFSKNQLSGKIPLSMSNLNFLSKLNLANNNLIGRIPLSTQLQSLNASGFIGNKLCGPPLTDNCTINNVKPNTKNEGSTNTGGHEVDWFYVCMALGYVVGFWVVWYPLLLNKQWRIMYFQFLDRVECKFRGDVHQFGSYTSKRCKALILFLIDVTFGVLICYISFEIICIKCSSCPLFCIYFDV
ncbi:receptor-like protein EIX2 [Quercus suber]|uniref:receptor-like protein EIX2 n=1 Tax=Quercus suber TaxID=58331 RepID=UPI000CE2243B|nr:receptor-like protein EIX2 [Quercus suber]XP_023879462.1 receptor-like protein EIX2 [Quercus suber]